MIIHFTEFFFKKSSGEKAGQQSDFSVLYIKRTYVREDAMAKKGKTIFVCQECGYESPQWMGQCICGAWNSFVEERVLPVDTNPASRGSAARAVTAPGTSCPHHPAQEAGPAARLRELGHAPPLAWQLPLRRHRSLRRRGESPSPGDRPYRERAALPAQLALLVDRQGR